MWKTTPRPGSAPALWKTLSKPNRCSMPIREESRFATRESSFLREDARFANRESWFANWESKFACEETRFARRDSKFLFEEARFPFQEGRFVKQEARFLAPESSFRFRACVALSEPNSPGSATVARMMAGARFAPQDRRTVASPAPTSSTEPSSIRTSSRPSSARLSAKPITRCPAFSRAIRVPSSVLRFAADAMTV